MEQDAHDSTSTKPLQALFFKILGEPASKANQRRAVFFGNKPRFIKSQKALNYVDSFHQQAVAQKVSQCLDADVCITIHIWYASRRPDLDESLILDCLQGIAYVNDRQVKEKHIYWHLDKECPRCEIVVQKKDPDEENLKPGSKRARARQGGERATSAPFGEGL